MSLISANFVLSTAPTPSYQIYILMEQDNPKIAQKDNFNVTNNASKYDKILFLERSTQHNIVCNDMHIDGCHGVVIVIAGD